MSLRSSVRKLMPKSLIGLYHRFYAWFGAVKYGHPSKKLYVIGVTGTTGKSSTVYWLRQVLEKAGYVVGSLSTIDFYVAGKHELNNKKMTMLGRMAIQRYLRAMANAGCDIAIVEMTSEGAVQYRHKHIDVDLMVLTTLYPEHIESHGSFENYKRAKLSIFEYVSKLPRKNLPKFGKVPKSVLINANIDQAKEFLAYPFDKKYLVADTAKPIKFDKRFVNDIFVLKAVQSSQRGLAFTVSETKYEPCVYGAYNAANLSFVVAVATIVGASAVAVQTAVNGLRGVPGRIEFIEEAEKLGFRAIVDYAFEPVALEALYDVVKLLAPKRVLHVAGATGGGRDKARRIPIGRLLGAKADLVFITDEDPYDENPLEIMKMVSRGAQEAGKKLGENLWEILDRKEAITAAIKMAQPGDLVLVTGKGSEQAMCIAGGKMVAWDDRKVIRDAIAQRK